MNFNRKDPVFDGTQKSAKKLLKKVFPKLSKYSLEGLSNTCVGGYWVNEKKKYSRIWVVLPSITPLQVVRLAYYFQTDPSYIILTADCNASPNCDQYWWNVEILKPNTEIWEWKPQ
jgi:hypothetical protein